MSPGSTWVVFAVIGAGTLVLRGAVIVLWGGLSAIPPVVERGLRFIPPAVLAALVFPALLVSEGSLVAGPRLFAGLVAIGVAWKTRNVLATIIVGMVTLWIIQALV